MRPEVCPARTEARPPDTGRAPEQRPAAYVVRCACAPGLDGTRGGTVVDHVRLFPLRPGVRWTYRVHEQILPSLKRAKIPVRWTDSIVQHKGYTDPAVEARKLDRNIRILEREVKERPNDPFVLFNLGQSAVEKREWDQALGYLGRSLAGSATTDEHWRRAVLKDRPMMRARDMKRLSGVVPDQPGRDRANLRSKSSPRRSVASSTA
jgi:hypothetical protein